MGKSRTVIIFGAGASKATHQLPLDADFLLVHEKYIREDFFLQLALKKIFGASNWPKESLENAWSEIDDNYNRSKVVLTTAEIKAVLQEFEDRAGKESGRVPTYYWTYFNKDRTFRTPHNYLFLFAGWELRKLMLTVYNASLRPASAQPYNKLFKRVSEQDDSFAVISFNYDTVAEQALTVYRYYPFKESNGYEFLKPHGSLNWKHVIPNDRTDSISAVDNLSVEDLGFSETECLIQHSIIGLTRTKREFRPLEESTAVSFYYPRILDRSAVLLSRADSLYIIGYSFPLGDAYLRAILTKLRQQRRKSYERIVYVVRDSKSKNKLLYKKRIARLFNTEEPRVEVLMNGFENANW